MKQTKNKELLQFVYAILLGGVVEAVYFTVMEYISYYWDDFLPGIAFEGFFFLYIAAVGMLVAIVISRYCKQAESVTGSLKALVALIGGVYLHLMILDHYHVVYYQLHGRFFPMADDFGPLFFMTYLGMVYLLWIPEVLFYII